MGCLPFVYCSTPNRTLVNMTSFSHSYVRSYPPILKKKKPFSVVKVDDFTLEVKMGGLQLDMRYIYINASYTISKGKHFSFVLCIP